MRELYVCKEYETPYEEGFKVVSTLADHDKQIRDQVIEEVNKILKDMYLEIANTVNGNDYTSKNDLVSVVASKCRQYASNRLTQMKGEQNGLD